MPEVEKKVFIHVGLHKTGSSLMRSQIFRKYPSELVAVNPKAIVSKLLEGIEKGSVEKLDTPTKSIIRKELKAIPQSILILSSLMAKLNS